MYGMKMTMHIDEDLLKRVIETYGYASKTEAVEMALRELDRQARYRELATRGLEMTPEEIIEGMDPNYDLNAMRVAETPTKYGK
jgi:Arc/MetJ family transcription regulator